MSFRCYCDVIDFRRKEEAELARKLEEEKERFEDEQKHKEDELRLSVCLSSLSLSVCLSVCLSVFSLQ